jgi:hypothetical protein
MKQATRRRQRRMRRLRRGGDENIAPNFETGSNVSADVFQNARSSLKRSTAFGAKPSSQITHEFQKVKLNPTIKSGRRTRRMRRII